MKINNILALGLLSAGLLAGCNTLNRESPTVTAQREYNTGHYAQAFNSAYKSARLGDAEAQYALGYMYYYGRGTAKDLDLARSWIVKSAKNGYPKAQHAVKMMMHDKSYQYTTLEAQTAETDRLQEKYKRIRYNNNPGRVSQKQKDLDWIRDQTPNNFTIATHPQRTVKLTKQILNHANTQQTGMYRMRVNGKTRFGGAVGSYKTAQLAKLDLQKMSAEIRKNASIKHWGAIQSIMLP